MMEETRTPWILTRNPWILTTVVLVYVVAIVALSSAGIVHNACSGTFGSEPPERGSRVSYCDAVDPTHPWFSFTIPPVSLMLVGGYLLRRHGWMALLLAVVLCIIVITNAIVATHLHASYFGA
jgi:hypothetical protein